MKEILSPVPTPPGWFDLAPLITLRRRYGVTQAALAVAADWHPTYVCALERGRVPRVLPWQLDRYRDALETLAPYVDDDEGNQAEVAHLEVQVAKLMAIARSAAPDDPGGWLERVDKRHAAGADRGRAL